MPTVLPVLGGRPGHDLVCGRFPPRPGRRIGYVMCVQPVAWPEPDPQIAAAIAAKYPGKRPRPLAVQVRDRLGRWPGRGEFAGAVGGPGRARSAPAPRALVTGAAAGGDPS